MEHRETCFGKNLNRYSGGVKYLTLTVVSEPPFYGREKLRQSDINVKNNGRE
jgi:hypothetical protein